MSAKGKEREQALVALYARVPDVKCKKLCQRACGPVGITMSKLEHKRVSRKYHRAIAVVDDLLCSELSLVGTCEIYELRPMVCRLWGAVDTDLMRCPFGCKPERWLTDAEAKWMLGEALRLGSP